MVIHDEDYDEKKMIGDIKRMERTKVSQAAVEAGKLKRLSRILSRTIPTGSSLSMIMRPMDIMTLIP